MRDNHPPISTTFIIGVSVLTFILPDVCSVTELLIRNTPLTFDAVGKWFIFSAVGLRLFIAGMIQIINPSFTIKKIFQSDSHTAHPFVRELGFANVCFGLVGIISLFQPHWRIACAFGSGLYFGLAGLQHIIKKPAGVNQWFVFITDIVIFALLLLYFIKMF